MPRVNIDPPNGGGGGGLSDPRTFRGQILYGGDPRSAMIQALMDAKINPYKANPFISRIVNAAPGLASAFAMQNMGMGAEDIAGQGGDANMLGEFLRQAVTGGNIFSTLAQGRQALPGVMGQLNNLVGQMGGEGFDFSQVNPFAQMLMSQMGDPEGFGGILGSLYTPSMSRGMGQAYQRGVGAAMTSGTRRMADDYEGALSEDPARGNFWNYVMGGGGGR